MFKPKLPQAEPSRHRVETLLPSVRDQGCDGSRTVHAWLMSACGCLITLLLAIGLTGCDCDQQFSFIRVGASCEDEGEDEGEDEDEGTENNTNIGGATVPDPLPGVSGNAPDAGDRFGSALAQVEDFELPGITLSDTLVSLAVGAPGSDLGATNAGALWLQSLNDEFNVTAQVVIASNRGGLDNSLSAGDRFGSAVAVYPDLSSDEVSELLVGAPGDDEDSNDRGAVWLLSMDPDGSVSEQRKLESAGLNSVGLNADDQFGTALAVVDFNGDGISEIVVGAPGTDVDDNDDAGAIWVLSLRGTGFVDSGQPITTGLGGFDGELGAGDGFGSALASVGNLNADAVPDLVVGAPGDDEDGNNKGAIWILLMNEDGTVSNELRIGDDASVSELDLSNGDAFGSALTGLSNRPVSTSARVGVGAPGDDEAGSDSGAIWTLDLIANGVLQDASKTTQGRNGFDRPLDAGDRFGAALADLGDPDESGLTDLAVGLPGDDSSSDDSENQGIYWILTLN